jgi:hypothetical protein
MSTFFPANSFLPWGWGTWRRSWEWIKPRWQFGYAASDIHVFGGWDVNCKDKVIKSGKQTIFPTVRRVKNIGKYNGAHYLDPNIFDKKHFVAQWADDFPAHHLLPQS